MEELIKNICNFEFNRIDTIGVDFCSNVDYQKFNNTLNQLLKGLDIKKNNEIQEILSTRDGIIEKTYYEYGLRDALRMFCLVYGSLNTIKNPTETQQKVKILRKQFSKNMKLREE